MRLRPLIALACAAPLLFAADKEAAGNEQVRKTMETFVGRGVMADNTPPSAPADALRRFKLRPGLAIDLMASEPQLTQPIFGSWDSRGRLWVTQYKQYPFPAGLKVVSYDQHLRAKFDKVPLPPPRGEKGADVITVLEDTDGDGFFDKHTDVIAGLNITTAALPGRGRIWVLNPPYLLSYADTDGDGRPEGDPIVELSGFGLEDTHATATSLKWGMDGWLYGANGSTTTGNISSEASKNIRWEGQCIWRFHPRTKVFEIYAEGGGNTYSLDIDAKGRVFSGTNYGATRGMHYEQGSYGIKGWGKHGPLTNPYAFGWFEHMRSEGDKLRFPQAFVIYEGGLLGPDYDGKILAPNALANKVYVSARVPEGSTFRTVDGANLLSTDDRWFRPVWTGVGPDGAVYLADWYDTRLSHVKPVDDWDKERGRVYRVRPEGAPPRLAPFDLHTAPAKDLLALLSHRNDWFRKQAVLEIGWRELRELIPALRGMLSGDHALEALWALDALGAADPLPLDHPDPYVRRWSVKILGERRAEPTAALLALARKETNLEVRAQILASAKRLPASGLPLLWAGAGEPDPSGHLPLLAWWALEAQAGRHRADILAFLRADADFTRTPLFHDDLAEKLARRYALAGGEENFRACADLLVLAGDAPWRAKILTGVAAAFEGAEPPALPAPLGDALRAYLVQQGGGELAAQLRAGDPAAMKQAVKELADAKTPTVRRIELARTFAALGRPDSIPPLVALLKSAATSAGLKRAVLQACAKLDDERIARTLLDSYETSVAGDAEVRADALRLLAGRKEWARLLVAAVDDGRVQPKHVTVDIARQLGLHHDPAVDAAVDRHWKTLLATGPTPEKTREMERIRELLRGGLGNATKGQALFTGRCAVCHKLFDSGGTIGPDLTGYDRQSTDFWLMNIFNPSLEIREGFGAYVAKLKDGRILTGLLDAQGGGSITLKDLAGNRTTIRQAEVETLEASPVSLMPEGLLLGMSDSDLRDFFAYLMK